MRPWLIYGFLLALALGACAMGTQTFETVGVPVDIDRVRGELEALFAYSVQAGGDNPKLPIMETGEAASEKIHALAEALHTKHADLRSHHEAGCLGENNRGYLELRECESLGAAADLNAAQQLFASVNKDRKALYYELALYYHHNDLPVGVIEEIASGVFIAHAPSSSWVQLPPSGARFDHFLLSDFGRSLGDTAKAAAWVQSP